MPSGINYAFPFPPHVILRNASVFHNVSKVFSNIDCWARGGGKRTIWGVQYSPLIFKVEVILLEKGVFCVCVCSGCIHKENFCAVPVRN